MPELPEVTVTLAGISNILLNNCITDCIIRNHRLRWPIDPDITKKIINTQAIATARRGKYMLIQFPTGCLIWHLGMSGRIAIINPPDHDDISTDQLSPPPGKHDHIDIVCGPYILRFNDARRFSAFFWADSNVISANIFKQQPTSLTNHNDNLEHILANIDVPHLKRLGPEPLTSAWNTSYLLKKCHGKKQPIKSLIMDQAVIVGIGNIYACETLFKAKIDPHLPAQELSPANARLIVEYSKETLLDSIAAGGTTLKDYRQTDGQSGYFKLSLSVYGRQGQSCLVCQTIIQKTVIGQRSTFFCPQCQLVTEKANLPTTTT